MSTTERFQQVSGLFEQARVLPADERKKFLRSACVEDDSLLEEVLELLNLHENSDIALDRAVPQDSEAFHRLRDSVASDDEPLPDRISHYRILDRLGVGGMGVVYLAQQDHPKREVAVKVIRPGIAGRELLRRFELEATVLGVLKHPGIAQIYEAGMYDDGTGGRPFFAMEYVEGPSLTAYLKDEDLNIRARLELFANICDAVHHAHQKGVIHRDLKPGNILVDASGQPKILDFGVARATDSDIQITTLQTDVGQLVGTLPYMSPEQVEGRSANLDTRSDVYALGVMLYEMLTDRLPHDLKDLTIAGAAQVICHNDPTPLTAVNRVYRGDLNTIALKALQKDPERRYQSASDLAADIRRYLNDEPIVARPATTMYQLRMFTKRNKTLVTAAGLLLITIVAASAISIVNAVKADQAAQRARWQAYLANIGGADSALQLHDVGTAERRLLTIDEADRGNWEWRHLMSRLDDSASRFGAEHKPRVCIAYSPDGRLLATGSPTGNALLWDVASQTLIRTLGKETSGVALQAVVFSPDGSKLLTTASALQTRVWNVETGDELAELERASSGGSTADWSGNSIAIGFSNGQMWFWNATTLKLEGGIAVDSDSVRFVKFSPDETRFATVASTVKIWRAETGSMIAEIARPATLFNAVAWDPNGARLATVSSDGLLSIWDTATGEELRAMRGHEGRLSSVDFSPDGALLVTGGIDRTVRLWDANQGDQLAVFRAHRFHISAVDFSPNGREIVSISIGSDPIHVWHADAADDPFVLDTPTTPLALTFTASGTRLVSAAGDGTCFVLDAATGAMINTLTGHSGIVWCVACSADGRMIATGGDDRSVRVWDAQTMSLITALPGESRAIYAVALNSDATYVAIGTGGSEVIVRDTSTGDIVHTLSGDGANRVVHLAFSGDDERLAAGLWGGTIRLWDVDSGHLRATMTDNTSHVNGLGFSGDGHLVSAHFDSYVHIWDAFTGRAASAPIRLPSPPLSMAFADNGKRLFIGTASGKVRVWDWPSRDELLVLRGLRAPVNALAVSKDRVAGADRAQLRLWDSDSTDKRRRARAGE